MSRASLTNLGRLARPVGGIFEANLRRPSKWARCSSTVITGSEKQHKPRILITGSLGQLGQGLAKLLRQTYGQGNVFSTDIIKPSREWRRLLEPYAYIDVLDHHSVESFVVNEHIDWIVHFSAVLSATGETNVDLAISLNIHGMQNVMDIARQHNVRLFVPSTIGAFGHDSPKVPTDVVVQRPDTIYGVAKVYTERLGEYMAKKQGLDFRSLRFPGVLSTTKPGGGTTDYAIEIFYDALRKGVHRCFLKPDTRLPMMYIDDCLRSVAEIMQAPSEQLKLRTYNVHAMDFTPEELAAEIRKHLPNFKIEYNICPIRQAIAESWPDALDDTNARKDWGWKPKFDLQTTVKHMLSQVKQQLKDGIISMTE